MGRYLDLAKKATEQSDATTPTPVLDTASRELLRQWIEETQIMRRGDNPDWLTWSPACRASWARSMLAIGAEWDFLALVPADGRAWLVDLASDDGLGAGGI